MCVRVRVCAPSYMTVDELENWREAESTSAFGKREGTTRTQENDQRREDISREDKEQAPRSPVLL